MYHVREAGLDTWDTRQIPPLPFLEEVMVWLPLTPKSSCWPEASFSHLEIQPTTQSSCPGLNLLSEGQPILTAEDTP